MTENRYLDELRTVQPNKIAPLTIHASKQVKFVNFDNNLYSTNNKE